MSLTDRQVQDEIDAGLAFAELLTTPRPCVPHTVEVQVPDEESALALMAWLADNHLESASWPTGSPDN